MGAVGVRPANERDDQQALPSKAEGHGGKQRSEGTIRVNIREPGFWESRLPQLQHRDQHREAEQTSDKCYIVHSNDMVPLYLDGTYGRSATVVRDSYSPVPNLTSYPSAIGTHNQGYRVTNSLGSPYTGGYTYSYGTTSNSSLLTPSRYRTPSPVRYSVQPRFRSRFYH